jgi:hypothetical protein
MFEPKENKGNLFKNDRKREGKQDADYRGTANIGGTLFWVNAWINVDKNGDKYMGLAFNPIDEKYKQKQEQQKYKVVGGSDIDKKPDPDDGIPF